MKDHVVLKLYMRVRTSDGSWMYARAAQHPNGRVKPNYAIVNGRAQHHPDAVYQLRYTQNGKRIWQPVGKDALLAQVELQRKVLELVTVEKESEQKPEGEQVPETAPKSLYEYINEYLDEVEKHKAKRTFLAYRVTLLYFADYLTKSKYSRDDFNDKAKVDSLLQSLGDRKLESIDRAVIMGYFAYLKQRKNSPRTLNNRAIYLRTFIRWAAFLPWPLRTNDMPKFTDKKVRAYNADVLDKMFRHATRDEVDLLSFFLCTGVREGEAAHACWTDLDCGARTYNVVEHLDLGFKPKDSEEGAIEIPVELVTLLQQRRARYPTLGRGGSQ